jgi:hypothetical protein
MSAGRAHCKRRTEEVRVLQKNSALALQLVLIVLVALSSSGCEAIGAIFKAGVWVGVIVVVLIIALAGFIAAKMRG